MYSVPDDEFDSSEEEDSDEDSDSDDGSDDDSDEVKWGLKLRKHEYSLHSIPMSTQYHRMVTVQDSQACHLLHDQ